MNNHSNPDLGQPTSAAPAPKLDVTKYAPYMEDFNMTEDQKRELLETLWTVMRTFVDLGFDVGKADVCGQLFDGFNEAAAGAPDVVEFSHSQTMETQATNGKDGRHE